MTSAEDDTMRTVEGASRGVYVHVPFCRRRCPYCDFAFEVRPADPRFGPAVVDELRARAHELGGAADTVSFGGGTPSALPARDLVDVVAGVRSTTGLARDAEVALELNPEDVTREYAGALRAGGFTRASLGVQSFDDDVLTYLGRAHGGARARDAVKACIDAGLRVGVDLIVGVPGERAGRLERDVGVLRELGVGHVSAYILTPEEGTPLVQLIAKGTRAKIDDDAQADAYEQVQSLLEAGWRQYEISSYARHGEESRHNRLYWQGGAYLGVGPSAHSMSRRDDGTVVRRHTTARLDAWLPAVLAGEAAAHSVEELAPPDALLEAVAFGLRDLLAGVSVAALGERHRCEPLVPRIESELARHEGLAEKRADRWHLTPRGARFADRVARAVLAVDVTRR